jgi:hypothetical protein
LDRECKRSGFQFTKMEIKFVKYDYENVFKKGASNANVDALSRVNRLFAEKVVTE